ncbi:MAG: PilZ domain-containing protein [Candidatus Thiodiazotropha sp.]
MNTIDNSDRRHFHRIVFDAPATIIATSGEYPTTLIDISLKGALALIPPGWQPNPGDPVTLKVVLDQGESLISMQASCAHLEGERVGLRCEAIDMESITRLRRLVELNLCDESLLQRDIEALGQ